MVIRKINTVFMRHSRWLFGIFTVVIIISFLGFLTPGQFGLEGFTPWGSSLGTIYGERFTTKELQHEMTKQYALGRVAFFPRESSPEEAVYTYAQVKAAEQRGITASSAEIAEIIKLLPAFRSSSDGRTLGEFSLERYKEAVAALARQGVQPQVLEEALRDLVMLNKLQSEVLGSVVVTDDEAEQFFRQFNEKLELKTAAFNADAFRNGVKPDGDQLNTFFAENRQRYQIPKRIQAEVVRIPFDDPALIKEAESAATPEELKGYYTRNPELFATPGADGQAPTVKPYEEVQAEVRKQYLANKTRDLAYRRAQQFARDVYELVDDQGGEPLTRFRELAAKLGIKPVATGEFDATAAQAGTIAEPELVRQLASVYEQIPVSNAVRGKDAAYVGLAFAITPSRPAEFNEVNKQIWEDYVHERAAELARQAAAEESTRLDKIEDGAARAKAFGEMKNCKFETREITPQPGLPTPVEALAVNEVSEVLPSVDGAMLVLMVKRTPADPAEFARDKELWKMRARSSRAAIAQQAFAEQLSENIKVDLESLR